MAGIEIEQLTVRYGRFVAVDGVSLRVAAGSVFGLLGPNGAGKTTLIKALVTLLPPDGGRIAVAGRDVVRQPEAVRRLIGYVPQALSADGTLTGRENLGLFARLYDVPRAERGPRIAAALAFMGLEDAADQLVRSYSGGMIRRLEIAQSLLHRPAVLILDEPTVGLDPVARQAVWGYVRQLRAELGMTVFLTTHYMEEAEALCDEVAIMHRGHVVAQGAPAALIASIQREAATLDDVFAHYTGDVLESGGGYRDVVRSRRTARRVG